MSNSVYHKELTDAQWNKIKFLFETEKRVGRPSLNPRRVLNAILWILKSGARWRDLPARYGNWNSIYHKFRKWCSQALFECLFKIVNADANNSALLEIDSTFSKVHQSACSSRKNEAIGSSCGGKNTKIHVLLNEKMQVINVTGGQINDSDKALEIRTLLHSHGALVCIPDKVNFKVKHEFDAELYKQRNLVELFFQRIKNYRNIAFRFDKLAVCFINFVLLASVATHF